MTRVSGARHPLLHKVEEPTELKFTKYLVPMTGIVLFHAYVCSKMNSTRVILKCNFNARCLRGRFKLLRLIQQF